MRAQDFKNKRKRVAFRADSICTRMDRLGTQRLAISTADHPNWDRQEHWDMPAVAEELRNRGLHVSSRVVYGVTDYSVTV